VFNNKSGICSILNLPKNREKTARQLLEIAYNYIKITILNRYMKNARKMGVTFAQNEVFGVFFGQKWG